MIISPTMRAAVGLWVLFAGFSAVFSHSPEYVHLEPDQSTSVPDGWKHVKKVAEDESLMLTFALKQQNVDQLEDLFWKVSDPDDELYGQHLSLEEIAAIVQPSNETIAEVGKWLEKAGVTECSTVITKDFLSCAMTVRQVQTLLGNVQFNRYTDGERTVIRSEVKYHVPKRLQDHLDFVGGVHRFPSGLRVKTEDMGNQSVGVHIGVYPSVLRQRYNLTADDVGSHPNNSQVVAQFLEQHFSNGDLSEFMSMFVGNDFVHQTEIKKIVGPNEGKSGIEASLDTQYIMGTGANITTWFWSTGGRHEQQEPFLTWLIDVGNTTVVPHVHSVSYGEGEDSLSFSYMQRINAEFMKLGARGVSVLFSSGDNGAGCQNNRFEPQFPAASPYATAVGGTAFYNPFTVGEEKGYDISGGGFSNIFKQPSYQKSAVDGYFQNGDKIPPAKYFDQTGRGYPDLAAISNHYWVVNNRIPVPGVAGTSASTPTVAGIISMVNEHRLKAGKPVLGFINPFIYKNPQMFYDVTRGHSTGCMSNGDQGFSATPGYDPVTGLGTPNYPDLVKAAMAMA